MGEEGTDRHTILRKGEDKGHTQKRGLWEKKKFAKFFTSKGAVRRGPDLWV